MSDLESYIRALEIKPNSVLLVQADKVDAYELSRLGIPELTGMYIIPVGDISAIQCVTKKELTRALEALNG